MEDVNDRNQDINRVQKVLKESWMELKERESRQGYLSVPVIQRQTCQDLCQARMPRGKSNKSNAMLVSCWKALRPEQQLQET